MNTWRRKALLGLVSLGLILGIRWIWLNRAEIVEAFEASTCRVSCPSLTAEQLRLQVVKAYLHILLDTNIEMHDPGGNYQLALLSRDMTAQDMARSITDATLLDILTANATILGSHAQIDALNIDSLVHDPSIATYSLVHRVAQIIPTQSIQKASATEVENYFRAYKTGAPTFSWWVRMRGYGQQFFWINQYWELSLACCDGRGEKNGLSRDWLNKNSLLDINSSRPQLMAVSNRGAILIRYHDGERFFLF